MNEQDWNGWQHEIWAGVDSELKIPLVYFDMSPAKASQAAKKEAYDLLGLVDEDGECRVLEIVTVEKNEN